MKHPPHRVSPRLLAGELRVVVGQLRRRVRERTNKGDLTLSQIAVLGQLDREGPATVTALAHAEGVRPQSMGATVGALQEAGFVTGAADPADGRQTLLTLTESGRAWIKASRAAREDWLSGAIRAHLSPSEQDVLARAIELLKRLVE